jgi:hypothetical protein
MTPELIRDSHEPQAVSTQVRALLERASTSPRDHASIGQAAAALWWRLDALEGEAPADLTPALEDALLAMAVWHTGDPRLFAQGLSPTEARHLLLELDT